MARQHATTLKIKIQVADLCENFGYYVAEFNNKTPFNDRQWSLHKKTIDLRNELGGVAESIASDEYMRYLYDTLEAWRMNSQAAKMQEYDTFVASVRTHKHLIALLLEGVRVAQINKDITGTLWRFIQGMQLSQRKRSQTVTGAKTLHHLLPQLLPPIDRQYTRRFFLYHSQQFQNNQEDAFNEMLSYFPKIAQAVNLGQYVGTAPWATSESKLIDNAIIGYCLKHPYRLPK